MNYVSDNAEPSERNVLKLPPSALLVLYVLYKSKVELSRGEIIDKSGSNPRTVGYALRILLDKGLVKRRKSTKKERKARGARCVFYRLTNIYFIQHKCSIPEGETLGIKYCEKCVEDYARRE